MTLEIKYMMACAGLRLSSGSFSWLGWKGKKKGGGGGEEVVIGWNNQQ